MSGSGDDKRKASSRRPLMSAEDAALWDFVARRLEPAKGKSRIRDVEPDASLMTPGLPHRPPAASTTPKAPSPATKPGIPPPITPKPPRQPQPQRVTLERRKARRIARGTEEIEARLDLHGMTQNDAHDALVGFIRRCHANGYRTVLVITGKGGTRRNRDDGDDVAPRPRGVLKQNVPRWLGGPELSAVVVSYSAAHIRHGGEGALYVRLRRTG